MRPNLNSLTEEIQQYLDSEQFVVFRSLSRVRESGEQIYWNTERYPDFRHFLECASKLGVRLVHFHEREFNAEIRQEATDMLDEADLPRDERRTVERRIEEFVIYEGLLCSIELSFDFDAKTYVFAIETEWFEEWNELLDEMDLFSPGLDDDESYPGYFSSN